MAVCGDNVCWNRRGTGTRRVSLTADSCGVRTAIQNHVAWLVNGIISDTREHRTSLSWFPPARLYSPSVLSRTAVVASHPPRTVSVVIPSAETVLSLFSFCFAPP